MPKKDIYHQVVRAALIKDGWQITDDPLTLTFRGQNTYVDLGAERAIGAEKGGRKIAVEIKSFINPSPVHDLSDAVGQYGIYREVLAQLEPDRLLYLAVTRDAYDGIFSEPFGQFIVESFQLRLLIFDEGSEEVFEWIP